MSKKVAAFVFFAGMTLTGVEMGQYELESTLLITEHIEALRADNPDVSEECIVVAANIKAGRYDDVQHMMQSHGRCATRIIGLRVAKVDYDY